MSNLASSMNSRDQLSAMSRALESAGLATWVWYPNKDEAVSANIEATFGVPHGSYDHRYSSFLSLVHPEDRDRVDAEITDTLRCRDTLHVETRLLLPDGTVRWIANIGTVDRRGKDLCVRGVSMNITDKKTLESRFLRSQRLESIGTLAGGIAHDLNNILTPIRLGVDLLRHIHDEGKRETLLDSMVFSVNRGVELLTQIVDFARGQETALRALSLGPILKAIGRLLEHTLPRSITLEVVAPLDLGRILGDTTQLSQVLVNLAINSRDAMPQGGRLVLRALNVTLDDAFARAYPGARAGRYVLVSVSDTGHGMEPAVLERIFDPFFTTKEIGKGSGLGLSTVRGIVRRHGGFLDVESTPGRGTTFRIWIPVTEEQEAPVASQPALPAGQQQFILIVDDEPGVRAMVQQSLEAGGYQVRTAANGAEALVVFSQHQAETAAVVVDLLMPVLDGIATIRALRQTCPDVPILPASGYPPSPSLLEELHLSTFLPKPFTTTQLMQSLREVLPTPSHSG